MVMNESNENYLETILVLIIDWATCALSTSPMR